MRRTPKAALSLVAVTVSLVASLVLASCGVSADTGPRQLPPEVIDAIRTQPPETGEPAKRLVTLWFIDEGKLVAVNRATDVVPSPQEKIDMLAQGPTQAELDRGLRAAVTSAVPDAPLVITAASLDLHVSVAPDQVAIVLSDGFRTLPSQEQLLVLGQVVATLATGGIKSVLFVDSAGNPVGVPLPGGRLQNGPVTPADFSSLFR
ncbi:MAG: hypothetical protein U0990_02305 [Candidatus Nanopelagicales bacterium]|nr:hypothetical protein [Candidatus Nanopelagicales bacterium]MDZ4248902.1 hypothetical protein [Candidatus Nanopelagicales bacterium]MDZ7578016.1 hypothetical protein [Candidatus Nanopelagicales bacterium]